MNQRKLKFKKCTQCTISPPLQQTMLFGLRFSPPHVDFQCIIGFPMHNTTDYDHMPYLRFAHEHVHSAFDPAQ